VPGLRIGPGIELPLDFATEAWAILARRGAGKSNAGAVMAEELDRNHLPFVVIDPKGDWWGIRSSADGQSPGLAIPVFGGRHGDIPLEPGAGNLIADLVLGDQSSYLSCVLDVSQFTLTEQRRFLQDFGDRLFRQKDEQGVLTLIFEEAHEYLPQVVPRDAARLVSTYQRIVKQGRQRGLGVGMLSQRSAALNKDVLTQIGALIPMWIMSPQDRAAVKAWVEVGGNANALINSLHELRPGEAWLWWPEGNETQRRLTFRRRWTFDSGATPKAGHKRVMPRTLADVDLAAVKEAMSETIEKAKAGDPKELRKRIRELERELATRPEAKPERIEVPVLTKDQEGIVSTLLLDLDRLRDTIESTGDLITGQLSAMRSAQNVERMQRAEAQRTRPKQPPAASTRPSMRPPSDPAGGVDEIKLGKTERSILTALVQHGGLTNNQLALLTGYSAKASTISVSLGKLRRWDLVLAGQPIQATDKGIDLIGEDVEPLPTGQALIDYWRNRFGLTERRVLDVFLAMHPNETSQNEVAVHTGYSPSASTISVALGKLRRVGVIDRWRLSDEFVSACGLG